MIILLNRHFQVTFQTLGKIQKQLFGDFYEQLCYRTPPGGCRQIRLHYYNSYFNFLSFLKAGIIFAIWRNGEKSDTCNMLLKLSMSKCPWSGWKWCWGVKEMPSPFPCGPVIRECSWKKTQIEKKIYPTYYFLWISSNVTWQYGKYVFLLLLKYWEFMINVGDTTLSNF